MNRTAHGCFLVWPSGNFPRPVKNLALLTSGGGHNRMATDLNIHRKSKSSDGNSEEDRARNFEIHNRERTWLVCYSLDRSISAQMGKPYVIREE